MTQKKKTRVAIVFLAILVGCGLLTYLFSQKGESASVRPTASSRSTVEPTPDLLEIPVLKEDRPEQIIAHKGYTVSYNSDWCVPNWVAYELTREEVRGTVPRAVHFEPDPDVQGVCPTYRDYSRSSYTRGHMAPAGDMKWDTTAMRESFYLSNVCPQDHNQNDGDWKVLEEQARSWAYKYGSVYIACGPIMSNNPEVIGRNNVAVPDAFYKVLLCKINGQWQALGFVFDNKPGHRQLHYYCRSIDEVENITGIDFFPALPDEVEDAVEAKSELSAWSR